MVVAGAEYEVNISLNTKTIEGQLNTLEKRINKMRRSINGPLSVLQRQAVLEDRIKASRVISFRLGQQLNQLEEKGVNVAKARRQITAATNNLNRKEAETARARNKIVGDFIKLETKNLDLKQKAKKVAEETTKEEVINKRMQAENIDAMQRARDTQSRFRAQINQLEARGVNVRKQRNQLGKLSTAQAKGEFGVFKQIAATLKNSIRNEKSKLSIQKLQTSELEKQQRLRNKTLAGGPMQFPSGRRLTSPFDVGPARALTQAAPSSFIGEKQLKDIEIFERKQLRAALNAHLRQLSFIQKETRAKIAGNKKVLDAEERAINDFTRRLNATIESRQAAGLRLMSLAGKAGRLGGRTARLIDASNLRKANASALPSSEMLAARAKKSGQELLEIKTKEALQQERIARAYERSAIRSGEILNNSRQLLLPEGRPTRPITSADAFGPQLPSRTSAPLTGMFGGRRAGDPGAVRFGGMGGRAGDIALGAGFPLLFGGGPGAVLGGALGGATGGGLAAQIALSAIGQQIDTLVARIAGVGSAFNELTFNLDTVATSTGIANTETQAQLEKIEQYGSAAQAAQLATELLASRVGGSGRDALKKFGEDAVTLGNNLNIIFTQVLAAIAKIAGPLLEKLAQMAGDTAARGAFDRATGLTGVEAAVQKFRTSRQTVQNARNLRKDLRAAGFTGDLPLASTRSAKQFTKDFALEAGKRLLETPEVKIEQIAAGIQTPEQESAASKEARMTKRLDRLDAERKKVLEISRFRDKIAAATAAEDEQLVIRLKGEQKIAEIEGKRIKDLAGVTEQREKDAINIGAATKKLAAHRDTERQLAELERQRQEKFETTIESLDHQLALARATTEEERERLRIEEALRKLREDDKLSQPQLDAIRKRMEALAEEKNLINTFIRETREQIEKLNNPMFQMISLATTLGDAFSQSFRGVVDGSMSAQEALANLFQRTADHFLDMAAQMIAAQLRMQAVQLFMSFFPSSGGGGGGNGGSGFVIPTDNLTPTANGNAFGRNGLIPFAKGGVVNKPTLFPFANGTGLMGEAGPEAIMPLRRGADGRLGVEAAGGGAGATSVVVNVDASGSNVEGDGRQAKALGQAIGAAVQAELIKQKRPGGLLS